MLYLTSYKSGDKFYCRVSFSKDDLEVEGLGGSFWGAFIACLAKGLILEIKLKIKKVLKKWKGR